MKNKLLGVALATSAIVLLSGCGSQMAKAIQPKIDLAQSSEVTANINKYTDGLDNLNEMLRLYDETQIKIAAMAIVDKTAEGTPLPGDITIMVNSALNEIGEQVEAYVQVDDLFKKGIVNSYIIQGAITEYDVLERSNRGANVAVHGGKGKGEYDADAGSTDDDSTAKLTIDFNIIDAQTGAFVSKVHTSNSIKIIKKSGSADFGFSIMGSGFGLSASASKEQGKHAAIRLLVDLSIIELIGKLKKQPYWICVPGAKKDRKLLRDIKRDFERNSNEHEQRALVDFYLPLLGVEATPQGIIAYKRRYGLLPANSDVTPDLYMSLLVNAKTMHDQKTSTNKSKQTYKNLL